jgi:DNA-binding MarR family transcriptional regulator
VGAQAAARFAERVSAFDVLPADVGVLRMVAGEPGRSQQSLAHELGVVASRVVALVDNLEGKGLLERRRSPRDRRHYELHLTPAGTTVMARIGALRAAHEDDICAALDEDERGVLMTMLEAIAAQQGLTTGVHPGYRSPAGRR